MTGTAPPYLGYIHELEGDIVNGAYIIAVLRTNRYGTWIDMVSIQRYIRIEIRAELVVKQNLDDMSSVLYFHREHMINHLEVRFWALADPCLDLG